MEVKGISLIFTGNIIVHVDIFKDSIQKLLELVNEFNKVSGYKVTAHKSMLFP